MTRTIQDQDLLLWEAYASAGKSGGTDRARIIFHCLTDPSRRARSLPREAGKVDVENEIATLADAELVDLLREAVELK